MEKICRDCDYGEQKRGCHWFCRLNRKITDAHFTCDEWIQYECCDKCLKI